MTAWTTLDPNKLLPAEMVTAVAKMANLINATLSTARAELAGVANLPSLVPPNPSTAVVTAVLDTLSGLLSAGRVHALAVPITKRVSIASPQIPLTLQDLQATFAVNLGDPSAADEDAYARMSLTAGGNAGFFQTFAASLMDLQDPNRPQYEGQTDAVVMVTLLVGAPSFAAIVEAASTIETLAKPKGSSASMTARAVPRPQNVRARPVATPSGTGIGVRLDWDAPTDAYQARYFPGVTITVKRYAVIRSTDAKMLSARSVLDLFSTQKLTEGLVSGAHRVVAIGSGRNAAYLDTDVDAKVPVYYAVAWESAVTEAGSVAVLLFDGLSNVTKVTPRVPPPAQTGTAPNWTATRSALEVFPDISNAANRLVEQARVLLTPSSNPGKRLLGAVKMVTDAAETRAARATALMADVARIAAALSRPIPSLYITQMSSTSGGNAFLLAELAKRLGDTTDTTRPPFDDDAYVCGVCFVAGAARLADLAGVIAFFDGVFGPAAADNPLLGLLDAIDTLVTEAEAAVFQPDMTPGTGVLDPITGRPPVVVPPVIGDDGKPVAVDDPKNPAAGETSVVPLASLC